MSIEHTSNWVDRVRQDHPGGVIIADRLATEVVSWGVYFGSLYVLNRVKDNPVDRALGDAIASNKSLLSFLDWGMDRLSTMENDEETAKRHDMSDADRGQYYAQLGLYNLLSVAATITIQGGTQYTLDKINGVELNEVDKYAKAAATDRVAAWTMAGLIDLALPDFNEQGQEVVQSLLEKSGVCGETASTISKFAINFCVPNIAGVMTSSYTLRELYKQQHPDHPAFSK